MRDLASKALWLYKTKDFFTRGSKCIPCTSIGKNLKAWRTARVFQSNKEWKVRKGYQSLIQQNCPEPKILAKQWIRSPENQVFWFCGNLDLKLNFSLWKQQRPKNQERYIFFSTKDIQRIQTHPTYPTKRIRN